MPDTQSLDHKPLVYVSCLDSYSGKEDSGQAQLVDELCATLSKEEKISVGRKKELIKTGDSIINFADQIASGGLILAVISRNSLRSDMCMVHELLQAFRKRNFESSDFGSDVMALILEDAEEEIRAPIDLIKYWKSRHEDEKAMMQLADPDKKGSPESWKIVDQLEELRTRLPDLIRALCIRAMPRGSEAIREQGFQAIRKLVLDRIAEKGLADRFSRPTTPNASNVIETEPRPQGNEQHFLALTLQRHQEASTESGDYLYSWKIDLKEPAKNFYEPPQFPTPSYLGPLLRRSVESTQAMSTTSHQSPSTIADLLQAIHDWLPKQEFGKNCVLELFVPLELLDFSWSAVPLRDIRRRKAPTTHLQALIPFVLRSWDRRENPNYKASQKLLESKFVCLVNGQGSWLAGDEACIQTRLEQAENEPTRVGIKRLQPLADDLDQRLDWLESMLLTMAPIALWHVHAGYTPEIPKIHGYLERFGEVLRGHNTGDPVTGDCSCIDALPLHRKTITDDPLVHDIAFLFDHPGRAPAASVDQTLIISA